MKQILKKLLESWRAGSWETRKQIRSTKLFSEKERTYDRVKDFYYVVA